MTKIQRMTLFDDFMNYDTPRFTRIDELDKLGFFTAPASTKYHGAYETDPKLWEYYGRAIEKYPNVLYTHTADMIASRIIGV